MGIKEIICLSLFVACAAALYCPTQFNFYPDASDCTKFYRCVYGRPIRFACAPGTRWNQHLLTCDHAYKVPCGNYQPATYNPEPEYNNRQIYQPIDYNTGGDHYGPTKHSEPDYYNFVDNYRYGGYGPGPNGYHKK